MLIKASAVTLLLIFLSSKSLKMCNSWFDYNIPFSTNCNVSDIDEKSPSQIIRDWGFTSKEYSLTTDDGYQLLIIRGYKGTEDKIRPVVILSHGLYLNALTFLVRGKESLGFNFMNEGYDVWIPNYRGTRYSKQHIKFLTTDNEFWNFSYHDIALYDVRNAIQFIYQMTNQKAIYIGFSMGSSMGVIYTSTYPEEAQKYLLGTYYYSSTIYWQHAKTYTYRLLKNIYPPFNKLFYNLFHGEFVPGLRQIIRTACTGTLVNVYICEILKGLTGGFHYSGLDPIGTILMNGVLLDSTSWKSVEHFLQNMQDDQFRQFDYGKKKNLEVYGQARAPVYNISNIKIPVGVILSKNDYLSAEEDVNRFYNEVPEKFRFSYYVIKEPQFAHLDYIQVKNINELFTKPLLKGVSKLIFQQQL